MKIFRFLMPVRMGQILVLLIALSVSSIAYGHEFWIEAKDWRVEPGDEMQLSLRVGTEFKGLEQIYFPKKINRFEWVGPKDSAAFDGRLGDVPAGVMRPEQEGLYIIRHETKADLVNYESLEKFERFVVKKGFPKAVTRHRQRLLPTAGFCETYRRFGKSLVAVGHGEGEDQRLGMEVEITALDNPFHLQDDSMRLQLHRDSSPWSGAWVTIFARLVGDTSVTIDQTATDDEGLITVQVLPGYQYLIDAVSLEEVDPDEQANGAVWASRWASLTFAVPLS